VDNQIKAKDFINYQVTNLKKINKGTTQVNCRLKQAKLTANNSNAAHFLLSQFISLHHSIVATRFAMNRVHERRVHKHKRG